MNKTELSIGDWVKAPKLVYDCGLEDFDNGMCKVRHLRDDDLDVYAFNDLKYSDVEPIVITKAILEKLGFVEKDVDVEPNTFEFRTDDLLVKCYMNTSDIDILKAKEKMPDSHAMDLDYIAANKVEFYLSAKILYVHQLQHLLRIVGKEFDGDELPGIYEF